MAGTASSDPSDGDLQTPLLLPLGKDPDGEHPKHEKLCIDDMLQKYCGEFGFWQLRHFILASLAWALEAFHTMVMIFADREPGWRCLDGAAGSGCYPEAKSVCELEPGSWEWIGGPGSSTVAEFGLVCGQKYKVGLVQALFFGGCMIGLWCESWCLLAKFQKTYTSRACLCQRKVDGLSWQLVKLNF